MMRFLLRLFRWGNMDEDSIDGLGLTIRDIAGGNAATIAQFRLTKRIDARLAAIQTGEVRDSRMTEFRATAQFTVERANAAREQFDKVGRS